MNNLYRGINLDLVKEVRLLDQREFNDEYYWREAYIPSRFMRLFGVKKRETGFYNKLYYPHRKVSRAKVEEEYFITPDNVFTLKPRIGFIYSDKQDNITLYFDSFSDAFEEYLKIQSIRKFYQCTL